MLKLSTLVLASTVATSAMASVAPAHLPFVRDDFARAQTAARQHHLPMFVEVWAPW